MLLNGLTFGTSTISFIREISTNFRIVLYMYNVQHTSPCCWIVEPGQGDLLLCSYYLGVRRVGFYCSYFAPDIVKFACSKVIKCPYSFIFFSNNYDPSFTVLFFNSSYLIVLFS